jgi:ATP-dependent RNA helicase SUPV3L1/SUV3
MHRNIKRIIFMKMTKYDGKNTRNLTVSETRQIGGRAGRFASEFSDGEVTTFEKADIPLLHSLMKKKPPTIRVFL